MQTVIRIKATSALLVLVRKEQLSVTVGLHMELEELFFQGFLKTMK